MRTKNTYDRDGDNAGGRQQKKKSKKKKKLRLIKMFLLMVLFISVVVILALSPVFNIHKVEVKGNQRYNKDEIINAVNIAVGSNGFRSIGANPGDVFALRYGKAEEKLEKSFPYVKEAVVRFRIPSTVSIHITERKPVAAIPYLGSYLLMDRDFYIVEVVSENESDKLPIVEGVYIKDYKEGQALEVRNHLKLKNCVSIIEAVYINDSKNSFSLGNLIEYIDVTNLENIYIFLDNSRIDVNIGDMENLQYKLDTIKTIYYKQLSDNDRGLLDFSSRQDPVFIPE